jgi:tRNA pseudouridine55 synthase
MGRKKTGRPISGWIAIDKPSGMTSATVVAKVKRALNAAKAGHGGTLDPLATGILPLALGEATKTVSFTMDSAKTYEFEVTWGAATDTDDRDGQVIRTSAARPTADAIRAALPGFTGVIQQVPPDYSAVKIDHGLFRVECGKGTYIRALVRDLSLALGTEGHISVLRRTRCGAFAENRAISLDKLEAMGDKAADSEYLLPVGTVLDDIPALALTEEEARRMTSGQAVALWPVVKRTPLSGLEDGMPVQALCGDKLIAVAEVGNGMVRPVRVLNH